MPHSNVCPGKPNSGASNPNQLNNINSGLKPSVKTLTNNTTEFIEDLMQIMTMDTTNNTTYKTDNTIKKKMPDNKQEENVKINEKNEKKKNRKSINN